jgi:hypothetical protein
LVFHNGRVLADSYLANPRWSVAEEVTGAIRRRFENDVVAIGAHGALAHGEDVEESDVCLVVVTGGRAGPRPATRRIRGIVVDISVISAELYLTHARTLSTGWPLAADQYLTTRPTYDPDGWYDRLRDTHLARLAETPGSEFATLGREAWYSAYSAQSRAMHLATWYDMDAALVALCQARVGTALVEGLLTRTYFQDGADAVRRTGVAGVGVTELAARLRVLAQDLAGRGRPVDGEIEDLFR